MPKPRRRSGQSPKRKKAVQARPVTRRLSVIAQDPSVRHPDGRILMATIDVPAEDLLAGPIGARVQMVDYDTSTGKFHGSHELPESLDDEPRAWAQGAVSLLDDYRFHAQNAYALVMKTLARFEFALGRRVGWGFRVHQLKVAPHGMVDANAFYSREVEGLVLGYFPGHDKRNVYTCLSHDVVVHETTHALIDGLRRRYLDPSGPDQAAFHEGFADIIALLSIYAQIELVEALLVRGKKRQKTAGFMADEDVSAKALRQTALFGLAEQMGHEINMVRGEPLRRSAELAPNPKLMLDPEYQEPHRRGEILVAAVMNGFLSAWCDRVQRAKVPGQKLHAVRRVAEEGADIAAALVTMWIRALDYMPPVHLTFADALSAALTADVEVRPNDERYQLRRHMFDSFDGYGIAPASRSTEPPGVWKSAPTHVRFDRVRFESMRSDLDEVFRFLWDNRDVLDVRPGAYTEVLSVRPCVRVGPDGFTLRETVAEYYQVARLNPAELAAKGITLPEEYVEALRQARAEAEARRRQRLKLDDDGPDGDLADEDDPTTPVYGGGVLVFDEYGRLKYHVHNDVFGSRQSKRLKYLWDIGQLRASKSGAQLASARLSALHRQRAIDARRFPEQGW